MTFQVQSELVVQFQAPSRQTMDQIVTNICALAVNAHSMCALHHGGTHREVLVDVQVSALANTAKQHTEQDHSPDSKAVKQIKEAQLQCRTLTDDLAACKAERDWLHEQLGARDASSSKLAAENGKLLAEIRALKAKAGDSQANPADHT